jgi:Domain of unknown function (DUF4845)
MRKQRGVTMIGWIFLLVPLAIVLYAGIRLAPEYLNYYKVITALKETASQFKGDDSISPGALIGAVERRFDVGYVDEPKAKEILVSKDENGRWAMTADYEKAVPLFGNLYLLMAFKTTEIVN